MKKNNIILLILITSIFLSGCKKYLEIPVEGLKTEEDVFTNYESFKDFVDYTYSYNVDPINDCMNASASMGGEAVSATAYLTAYAGPRGLYNNFNWSIGWQGKIWETAWKGIRHTNVGLANLDKLIANQDDKDLIEGQLRFFRAYFHFLLISNWGSMPYIEQVLDVETMKQNRYYEYKDKYDYQACTEHIVEDLDIAISDLPVEWENATINLGRVTKVASLALKAKALLYAGSPMMNKYSRNSAVFDKEYMERAAHAANEVIKYAEDPTYTCALVPLTGDTEEEKVESYVHIFCHTDGSVPWGPEIIWGHYPQVSAAWRSPLSEDQASPIWATFGHYFQNTMPRLFIPAQLQRSPFPMTENPTQNYVDKFEMADGSLYDVSYDSDNSRRWADRDPRFKMNFYVDRDYCGYKQDEPSFNIEFWTTDKDGNHVLGQTRSGGGALEPYTMRKFWPKGINEVDVPKANPVFMVPYLRMADVYLMYAEACNEAWGTPSTVSFAEAILTPLEAVNKVRTRVGAVPLNASGQPVPAPSIGQIYPDFRSAIRNERAVELSYEGSYWYDLRRWELGPKLANTPIYTLNFSEDWKPESFVRVELLKRIYESPKHDWMPLKDSYKYYESFPQNEGWD